MKIAAALLFAAALAAPAFAKPAKPAAPKTLSVLTPGTYTATLKQLACEGCPPWIVKQMKELPEVADASVDMDKRLLTFTVKPGAKLKVETVQKKLNAAADQMGMGADYTLKDLKPAEKKGEAPKAKR